MNKIINWVGGSFFRTIGRLIVYILLGYILALLLSEKNIKLPIFQVLDVHANTINTDGWLYNVNRIEGSRWYNWTSESAYSELSITLGWEDIRMYTDNNGSVYTQWYYAYKDNINPGTNGITLGVKTNFNMYRNYLYSASVYIGSSKSISRHSNSSFIIGDTPNASVDYSYMVLQSVECGEWSGWYSYCYVAYGVVQPSASGYFLFPRINGSSGTDLAVFGYNIEVLGSMQYATKTDITNAINNSGLATANSVSQVQSSLNQVQQEIQGTQDAIDQQTQQQQENHEETINTITDDSINENGVSDFSSGLNKEYSSLTPFSDFLNLPLTWIQSLFASGQNCTAIHLPLPYLNNKYLDLPCMTEFWQQMGAIGTLVQVVWIAIVGVRIFNGLFLLTCETIDPNPDKDMTKLRTWEL